MEAEINDIAEKGTITDSNLKPIVTERNTGRLFSLCFVMDQHSWGPDKATFKLMHLVYLDPLHESVFVHLSIKMFKNLLI